MQTSDANQWCKPVMQTVSFPVLFSRRRVRPGYVLTITHVTRPSHGRYAGAWDLESLKADLEEYEGPHAARPPPSAALPAALALPPNHLSNSAASLMLLPPATSGRPAGLPVPPASLLPAGSNGALSSALPPPPPAAYKLRQESLSIAKPSELQLQATALLSCSKLQPSFHDLHSPHSASRSLSTQRQKSRQRPGERAPIKRPPSRGKTTGQIHV